MALDGRAKAEGIVSKERFSMKGKNFEGEGYPPPGVLAKEAVKH